MSNDNSSSFRWRTTIEIAAIAIIIYAIVGSPGLPSGILTSTSDQQDHLQIPLSRAKTESIVYPDTDLKCSSHDYDIHIFSTSPLIIYIDGFVSNDEARHLVDIRYNPWAHSFVLSRLIHHSSNKWQVSTVFNGNNESTDESVRKSEKALIDRDHVVQCIEQRALSIQGWPADTFIERLWTQRYNVSGHYSHHYDWGSGNKWSRRASTFMVYLSAECTGGGTNFPRLQMPEDQKWCQYLECNGSDEGVTFRAKTGNAVFWMNFDSEGKGYRETIHAGMPVLSGTKVGLNIWSWYQYQAASRGG